MCNFLSEDLHDKTRKVNVFIKVSPLQNLFPVAAGFFLVPTFPTIIKVISVICIFVSLLPHCTS